MLFLRTGLHASIKAKKSEDNILSQKFKMDDGYACNGDSGGPIFVERDGSSVLVGVTSTIPAHQLFLSWPPPCRCNCEDYPEVHARVSAAVPWIKQEMAERELTLSCPRKHEN